MKRPSSIIVFDRLFWGSLLAGIVGTGFAWEGMMLTIARESPRLPPNTAVTLILILLAIFMAISIALWYGITRRASNGAKWIYTIWMGVGSVATFFTLGDPTGLQEITKILSLMSTVLTLMSIICLFRSDATEWFKYKGRSRFGIYD